MLFQRRRKGSESFIPFSESEPEYLPEGELVYADDHQVKTRRWIWRQSEIGKLTEEASDVFVPIDGFRDYNKDVVLEARDELAEDFSIFFNKNVEVYFLNFDNNKVKIM